ncbi:YolD-like family protein [Staphylococcus epidermidis]|nr:YolD-like family protein [Staphylococcus epidermidis]MCO6345196.1 YolD-like family protein [Staphylococcus epidermidis]
MYIIPKQYKDETDYRKITREYLDSNIPKGRGFVKWLAFKTIPEQYQQIEQYMEEQNKTERPTLLDDQLNVLNEKVNWKKHYKEEVVVIYWKQGYSSMNHISRVLICLIKYLLHVIK